MVRMLSPPLDFCTMMRMALVRNKKVKYYTLFTQVLANIVSHNLLPKSGEYSQARGCAPLLIYCLLRGIKVNIPRLIIDFILFEHLLIPSRNLPYGIILTRVFKHLKIDLSDEKIIAPSIDIDRTLLKRMQARLRAHAPPYLAPPVQPFASGSSSSIVDPFTSIMTQLNNLL